jgi:hypothetical protein
LFLLSEILEKLIYFDFSLDYIWNSAKEGVSKYFGVISLDILFIIFLWKNNWSVVLGDKQSHNMVLHLAQINHFFIFFLVFFPYLNLKIFRLFDKDFYNKDNILNFLLFFIIIFSFMIFADKFSFTHDFILSDNRHYSFYYFKKIYNIKLLRFMIFIWTSVILSLIITDNEKLRKDPLIISSFICTFLILVPAKLFEFRYLSLCYVTMITIIHYYNNAKWPNIYSYMFNYYNVVYMIIVNAITLIVFIFIPFKNSFFNYEYSRFMW